MVADNRDQDVAVAVPSEAGVEAVELYTRGGVAEASVVNNLLEDVDAVVGQDPTAGEVILRNIGQIYGHVVVIVTGGGHGRLEGQSCEVASEVGEVGRVDDVLDVAVVVEAVANGRVG